MTIISTLAPSCDTFEGSNNNTFTESVLDTTTCKRSIEVYQLCATCCRPSGEPVRLVIEESCQSFENLFLLQREFNFIRWNGAGNISLSICWLNQQRCQTEACAYFPLKTWPIYYPRHGSSRKNKKGNRSVVRINQRVSCSFGESLLKNWCFLKRISGALSVWIIQIRGRQINIILGSFIWTINTIDSNGKWRRRKCEANEVKFCTFKNFANAVRRNTKC